MSLYVCPFIVIIAFVGISKCDDDDVKPVEDVSTVSERICHKNEYRECKCESGAVGVQYCSKSEREWKDCECLGDYMDL